MFDEVQEFSKGKLASKAVKSFPNASYRFGFTATMPKDPISKLNIISYLGPTRDTADAVSLADMGYLTPPCIQIVKMKSDPTIDDLDLSYPEVYDKYITNNKNRNDYIANMVEKIRDKPSKTLIITKNLDHAKALNRLIPGSHLLMGKNSLDERDEKVKEFIKEESSVLIGTVIFQTGINIPEITHLINARGLKSEVATLQAAGRALRRHDSKSQVYIYDFIDDAPYLLKHSKQRVKSYKSLGFEVYLIDENQKPRE
jgi:superfamily II DNA or RNA helicase